MCNNNKKFDTRTLLDNCRMWIIKLLLIDRTNYIEGKKYFSKMLILRNMLKILNKIFVN